MTFSRVLVTGHTGGLGLPVLQAVRRRLPNAVLVGAARSKRRSAEFGKLLDEQFTVDMRERTQIAALVEAVRPDAVVHLAGLRSAPLEDLIGVNVLGFDNLMAQLAAFSPEARIVVMGSAAELGRAGSVQELLDESSCCEPVDEYGVSKLAQSAIAGVHGLRGMDVVRLRLFNLIGPGLPETLLGGRCARLLRAASAADGCVRLEFGSLDSTRDYVDIRDVGDAVARALTGGQRGALYNISSGIGRTGHHLVRGLIAASGLSNVTYEAAEATREPTVPWQAGSFHRAFEQFRWQPTTSWEDSLRDLWSSTLNGDGR
jgi:nucleoside-diphosphate-sugar epimerase